jgi:serine/threonine protein kinase
VTARPRPTPETSAGELGACLELAQQVVDDMAQAWRQGHRPSASEYLARHPELSQHTRAAVQVIYEEICLRQEAGLAVDTKELLDRFPQWRSELEVVFDCHGLLQQQLSPAGFPEPGQTFGEFQLHKLLGRGLQGRVYLASQPSLADRQVVLKVSSRDVTEHLSLARLQHPHIVPLFTVYDFPDRNLQCLCMPFLGGITLADTLTKLNHIPAARRTGLDLLHVMQKSELVRAGQDPATKPIGQFLANASYVQAICWIGSCLADALDYAHQRNLVHLDLKPSNILLADDGQPMLLDFHLAREPLALDAEAPAWMGGTPLYMAPEQELALAAVRERKALSKPIDRRADLFSLGVVLHEALGGKLPVDIRGKPTLHRQNRQVPLSLARVLHKCMAAQAQDRYETAAELAIELRRCLAGQKPPGVRDRRKSRWLQLAAITAAAGLLALGSPMIQWWHAQRVLNRDQAKQIVPGRVDVDGNQFYESGMTVLKSKRPDLALAEFSKALAAKPNDFWLNYYRGVCSYELHRYQDAITAFSVAVALSPENASCYYNRGLAYQAAGDYPAALKDYDRALEIDPRLADAAMNRGIVHFEMRHYSQAVSDLQQAAPRATDKSVVYYNLALVYRAQGDFANARASIRKSLALDPENPDARELAGRLR